MSRRGARGLLAAAGAAVLAIGLTPSAASAGIAKVEICLNSGFCMQIINTDLPSTPVPGEVTVSGSAAGVSADSDVSLR
jgi:hypothetical protein